MDNSNKPGDRGPLKPPIDDLNVEAGPNVEQEFAPEEIEEIEAAMVEELETKAEGVAEAKPAGLWNAPQPPSNLPVRKSEPETAATVASSEAHPANAPTVASTASRPSNLPTVASSQSGPAVQPTVAATVDGSTSAPTVAATTMSTPAHRPSVPPAAPAAAPAKTPSIPPRPPEQVAPATAAATPMETLPLSTEQLEPLETPAQPTSPSAGPNGPKGGKRGVAVAFAIIALLGCAGLGYHAFTLRSTVVEKDERIGRINEENQSLRDQVAGGEAKAAADASESSERIEKLNRHLAKLNGELEDSTKQLQQFADKHEGIAEQLEEYKKITAQFQEMIDAGQLKVEYRHGRMMLELPAAVLFPTGSAELSKDGQKTVRQVARILRTVRNRRFLIAGHTDNVPARNEQWASNWELSTARAVTVTNALIASKVLPGRLGAAGFAENDPIAANNSEENRQQNRRIEIIVEAKIPEIEDEAAAAPKAKTAKKKTKKAGKKRWSKKGKKRKKHK